MEIDSQRKRCKQMVVESTFLALTELIYASTCHSTEKLLTFSGIFDHFAKTFKYSQLIFEIGKCLVF